MPLLTLDNKPLVLKGDGGGGNNPPLWQLRQKVYRLSLEQSIMLQGMELLVGTQRSHGTRM